MSLTGGWARWSGGPVLVGLIVLAGLTAGACTSSSDVVDDELTGGSASRDDAPLSGPVRDNPVTADSLPVVSESLPVISDYGAYTIDLENGAVTSVLIDDDPDLNLSPDGTRIAYMGRDGLFMADSDGSNEVKLAEERIPKVIYWFPDSSGFVYSNDESTSIFDAERREIVQVADERAFNIGRTYYAWSTDGQEVIYATSDGLFSASRDGFIRASLVDLNESTYVTINRRVGATHLYLERPSGAVIVEISGRNERILTRDRYPHMDWVSWSLDGTRVIYS